MNDTPRILTPAQAEEALDHLRWLAGWVDTIAVTEEHRNLADAWTELDRHLSNGGTLPAEWTRAS